MIKLVIILPLVFGNFPIILSSHDTIEECELASLEFGSLNKFPIDIPWACVKSNDQEV